MKTKSYTIHTKSGVKLQVSETPDLKTITFNVVGPTQFVTLDKDEFDELCGMKYDLKCEKVYDPELSQVPDLSEDAPLDLPTDALKKELEHGEA